MGQRSVDHKSKRYAAHSPNVASSEMHCRLCSLCYCRCSSLFLSWLRHEWQQLIFIRRRRSCSLCRLPLAGQGYRMWLPQLLLLLQHVARCKRANKLRIDLCDLWHSSKINLNKRSVLVSTLSSLSCSAHLSFPPGKCKFYMKIKEFKTEAATKDGGKWHAACGKRRCSLRKCFSHVCMAHYVIPANAYCKPASCIPDSISGPLYLPIPGLLRLLCVLAAC